MFRQGETTVRDIKSQNVVLKWEMCIMYVDVWCLVLTDLLQERAL